MSKLWYVVNNSGDVMRVSITPIDAEYIYDTEEVKVIEFDSKLEEFVQRVNGRCDASLAYGVIKFIMDYLEHENVKISEPKLIEEIFNEAFDEVHNLLCEKLNSLLEGVLEKEGLKC